MKIAVRVDSNAKSGFGHFSRTLNLVRTWKMHDPNAEVLFIGNFNTFALNMLQKYQIPHIKIQSDDYSDLMWDITDPFDLVIYDSYFLHQNIIHAIGQRKPVSVLIDDECKFDYSRIDIVVNFRFQAENLYQYNSKHAFLGINYFVVKPELVQLRQERMNEMPEKRNKLLLFLGGGFNQPDFVSQIINLINEKLPEVEISLIENNSKFPTGKYNLLAPSPDIERYLASHDWVISGGGIIKYEASFALVPNASFSTTMLQFEDSMVLEGAKMSKNLGYYHSIKNEQINHYLVEFIGDCQTQKQQIEANKDIFPANPTLHLIEKIVGVI